MFAMGIVKLSHNDKTIMHFLERVKVTQNTRAVVSLTLQDTAFFFHTYLIIT